MQIKSNIQLFVLYVVKQLPYLVGYAKRMLDIGKIRIRAFRIKEDDICLTDSKTL